MDITEIIVSAITSLAAVIVAVIGGININQRKKDEKLYMQRATEARLGMDMQAASIELSDVIAIAVTGGHTNGNVEEARAKAKKARDNYYAFINSVAVDALTKH